MAESDVARFFVGDEVIVHAPVGASEEEFNAGWMEDMRPYDGLTGKIVGTHSRRGRGREVYHVSFGGDGGIAFWWDPLWMERPPAGDESTISAECFEAILDFGG